jgi:hypothetical protein
MPLGKGAARESVSATVAVRLSRRMSLLLALSGHANRTQQCPLALPLKAQQKIYLQTAAAARATA